MHGEDMQIKIYRQNNQTYSLVDSIPVTFLPYSREPAYNNLGEKSFNSPTDFLNSTYNSDGPNEDIEQDRINGFGYTEGYILPTTPEEDGIIKENFMKAVNEGYDLLKNQCAKGVQKALNSVGIKTTAIYKYNYSTSSSGAVFPMSPHNTVEVNPYLPSSAFKAIRDNNPKGIYIKK